MFVGASVGVSLVGVSVSVGILVVDGVFVGNLVVGEDLSYIAEWPRVRRFVEGDTLKKGDSACGNKFIEWRFLVGLTVVVSASRVFVTREDVGAAVAFSVRLFIEGDCVGSVGPAELLKRRNRGPFDEAVSIIGNEGINGRL